VEKASLARLVTRGRKLMTVYLTFYPGDLVVFRSVAQPGPIAMGTIPIRDLDGGVRGRRRIIRRRERVAVAVFLFGHLFVP